MKVLILPVLGYILWMIIFKEQKSDISKFREALKDTKTDELEFIKELIDNELKNRF